MNQIKKMKMINMILVLTILQSILSCNKKAEKEIFLIPYDYRGKVIIIYNWQNGAKERYENGSRIYDIPINGVLLTKFKDEYGIVNQTYYLVDSLGNRKLMEIIKDESRVNANNIVAIYRAGSVGVYGDSEKSTSIKYQKFYVSDKQNFESYFNHKYNTAFDEKIKKLTGVSW
ncbi:MAG: hypothetical protein Q8K70_00985 [Bacteroidota bacterium]|nr:hypothetical protein [Bacteroidota bacterium]